MLAAIVETPWDALAVSAVAVAIAVVAHGRHVSAKLGRLEVSVGQVERLAEAIDTAVNHRGPGEVTMSVEVTEVADRCSSIEASIEELRAAVCPIPARLDAGTRWMRRIDGRVERIEEGITRPDP